MIIEILSFSLSGGLPPAHYSKVCASSGKYDNKAPFPFERRERGEDVKQIAWDGPGKNGLPQGSYLTNRKNGIFGSSNPYVGALREAPIKRPMARARWCGGSRKGRL